MDNNWNVESVKTIEEEIQRRVTDFEIELLKILKNNFEKERNYHVKQFQNKLKRFIRYEKVKFFLSFLFYEQDKYLRENKTSTPFINNIEILVGKDSYDKIKLFNKNSLNNLSTNVIYPTTGDYETDLGINNNGKERYSINENIFPPILKIIYDNNGTDTSIKFLNHIEGKFCIKDFKSNDYSAEGLIKLYRDEDENNWYILFYFDFKNYDSVIHENCKIILKKIEFLKDELLEVEGTIQINSIKLNHNFDLSYFENK